MVDSEQLKRLRRGVGDWNAWRDDHPAVEPDLRGADLGKAHLAGADLRGGFLNGADLREADLSRACLSYALLTEADLSGADLTNADLDGASFADATLDRTDLRNASLVDADLCGADLSRANLAHARFRDALLATADLGAARLHQADLAGADLHGANLINADLREANCARAILRNADLTGAALQQADMSEAVIEAANLKGADIAGAELTGTILTDATLLEADLSNADLRRAHLAHADLSGADLTSANLRETTLLRTRLQGATLSNAIVYGASVWEIETDEDTVQTGLVVTEPGKPTVMVDDVEIAQFVHLLLNREKLRDAIDAVTRKGVLILGRFREGGLELLEVIADEIRNEGYAPMIFDFPRPETKTYVGTVTTLVGLSRFVIVDVSGASVPFELNRIVNLFKIPIVPILQEGYSSWSTIGDLLVEDHVVDPVVRFTDVDELLAILDEDVVMPAENMFEERQRRLDRVFGRI